MNDWMDKLESELGELAPRGNSRDLVAVALCAHRDSRVLTAKRLRRELTPDELEAAFAVLDEKYPGVVADTGEDASPVVMAFIQTPAEIPPEPVVPQTTDKRDSKNWWGKLALAAALLLCFAGGIAIGLRSGATESPDRLVVASDSRDEVRQELADEVTGVVQVGAESRQPDQPLVQVGRKGRTDFYGDRQQSSLSAYSRAYHRKRLHASL